MTDNSENTDKPNITQHLPFLPGNVFEDITVYNI